MPQDRIAPRGHWTSSWPLLARTPTSAVEPRATACVLRWSSTTVLIASVARKDMLAIDAARKCAAARDSMGLVTSASRHRHHRRLHQRSRVTHDHLRAPD